MVDMSGWHNNSNKNMVLLFSVNRSEYIFHRRIVDMFQWIFHPHNHGVTYTLW
jgi:hypothetical protein